MRNRIYPNNSMLMTLVLTTCFIGIAAMTASAATFTVISTADSGPGSLRDAIDQANANGEADTISFDPIVFATPQTIATDGFAIAADGKVTVVGPAAGVTLSLAGSSVANSRAFSIFDRNAELEISHLTLMGAHTFQGGGIYSVGTVTLRNCVITDNSTTETGGGLTNIGGTMTVIDSTVDGNTSIRGGGIFAGALAGAGGTLTVTNSTIAGNNATVGGGIFSTGTFIGDSIQGGNVNLINSTLAGNSARAGGGMISFGQLTTLINATVTSNSAESMGGGIYQGWQVIAGNSIFAENSAAQGSDFAGFVFSNGYNLFGTVPTSGGNLPSDMINNDPKLGPLQDNGGPTFTRALLPGSPAIDAGNSLLLTDQRGFSRRVDFPLPNALGGNGSDIGAFEAGKEQCKQDGWMILGAGLFPNQGQCVSFVNTGQ